MNVKHGRKLRARTGHPTYRMTLGDTQRDFARHVSYLIQHINAAGYECTGGDLFRDPKSHGAMGEKGVYGRK